MQLPVVFSAPIPARSIIMKVHLASTIKYRLVGQGAQLTAYSS